MPIHAKAPMFLDEGRIAFQKREYGDLKPGKLLLRVEANAICGTDPIGTRGAICLMDFCGQCRSCRHGHTDQCSAKRQVSAGEATLLLDVMGTTDHAVDSTIIAHQVPRAEIDRAFELFLAGATGKVVVVGNDQ